MDLHEAIRTRRTIQRFRPDPVAEDVLQRALTAAALAPNHKTTWPFRFLLAGPATRAELFAVALRLKSAKRGPSPELEQQVRDDVLTPDRLVVVVQAVAADANRAEEDFATCACAVQNLMLSLHADGVGTKWNTGGILRDPETLRILGVDPATHRITAFVYVGWAEIVPSTPPRPPLADLVRRLP